MKQWDDWYFNDKPTYTAKKNLAAPQYKDDHDFAEVFTAPAGLVQYGQRTKACELIQDKVVPKLTDTVEATKAFIAAFEGGEDELNLKGNLEGMNILAKLKDSQFVEMLKNETIDVNKMWR